MWLAGGRTAAKGRDNVAALSGMASLKAALAEHAAQQFGSGSGAEAEIPCNFLVGLADRKPRQHLALAGGQRLATRNVERYFERFSVDACSECSAMASSHRSTTSLMRTGLTMKSNAPWRIASTASGMAPWAVVTKIGAGQFSERSFFSTSNPERSTASTSMKTQTGVRVRA
jgi:hypothetical protein